MHEKSLHIKVKVFGPDHPDTALSYCNIGIVYKEMDECEKALEYFHKNLEIIIKVHGQDHLQVARTKV